MEADNNWEFTNVSFQRDQPDLLYFITRKKSGEDASVDLTLVLTELESIKKHSTSISNDLKNIQRDNQMLWNESSSLRTQYQRQQETIDKIVRFLASLFSKVSSVSHFFRILESIYQTPEECFMIIISAGRAEAKTLLASHHSNFLPISIPLHSLIRLLILHHLSNHPCSKKSWSLFRYEQFLNSKPVSSGQVAFNQFNPLGPFQHLDTSTFGGLQPIPPGFGGATSLSTNPSTAPILNFGPSAPTVAKTRGVSEDVNDLQTRLEDFSSLVDFDPEEEMEPLSKKVKSFEQGMNESELSFDELFDLTAQ